MKELNALITNTTSLVGYIAVLMFVGAYLGGDQSYAFDPALLKGSILESRDAIYRVSTDLSDRSVIVTIDGRQYEAMMGREVEKRPEFTY